MASHLVGPMMRLRRIDLWSIFYPIFALPKTIIMGMDRNTVIGFVLLGLLLFAYLFFSTKNSQELQKQQKLAADSIANVRAHEAAQAKLRDTAKTATATVDTGLNVNVI